MHIGVNSHLWLIQQDGTPVDAVVVSRVDDALSISWDVGGIEYYGVCETDRVRAAFALIGHEWFINSADVRVSFSVDLDNIETGDYVL